MANVAGERLLLTARENNRKVELIAPAGTVPDLYIDGMHGVMLMNNIVKINAYSQGYSSGSDHERREVVCRLVMPVTVFASIAEFFKSQLNRLIEEGIVVRQGGDDLKPEAGKDDTNQDS